MSEISPGLTSVAFEHILVVDRFSLTGTALTSLAKRLFPRAECEHVSSFSQLLFAAARCRDKRLLVVMEVVTDIDVLSRGLFVPSALRRAKGEPVCRIMICTDLTDPLLLRMVSGTNPAVLSLRTETLAVLASCMLRADMGGDVTYESPGVRKILAQSQPVKLTKRERQWLITRIDGIPQEDAARAMGVGYKTASSFSHSVAVRMGFRHRIGFIRWLAGIIQITGNNGRIFSRARRAE
ncbi:hypothetical protein [Enterobacter mori]|uniref:hypothetical protein n=1 Tax=Enterobacter mori TaxID=539813 RepID=UPI003B83CE1E